MLKIPLLYIDYNNLLKCLDTQLNQTKLTKTPKVVETTNMKTGTIMGTSVINSRMSPPSLKKMLKG